MTGSFDIGRFAGLVALLSTVAIPPTTTVAATTDQADEGVSMAVASDGREMPTLIMMRRDDMAGEAFSAGPFEVIQLLLSDGTTLTLGSGTRLSVDHYAYDQASGRGELAMSLSEGVLKIVGGSLNNTTPIDVQTPGGKVTLDNATAVIVVEEDGATSTALEYGKSVVLTTDDGDQFKIVRPGFELTVASDGDVSGPYRRAPGDAIKIARALNPGLVTGLAPVAEVEDEGEPAPEDVALAEPIEDTSEDDAAQSEEMADQADEETARVEDDLTDTRDGQGDFNEIGAGGDLVVAGGFDAGAAVGAIDAGANTPSQSSSDTRSLAQNRDPRLRPGESSPDFEPRDDVSEDDAQFDKLRPRGLTSNVIFNTNEAGSVDLGADGDARPRRAIIRDENGNIIGSDLQYVFFGQDELDNGVSNQIALIQEGDEDQVGGFLINGDKDFSAAMIADTLLPFSDKIARDFIVAIGDRISDDEIPRGTPLDGGSSYDVLQSGFALVPIDQTEGTVYEGYKDFGDAKIVVDRRLDNFIMIQLKPAILTNLDALRSRFDLASLRQDRGLQEEFAGLIGLEIDSDVDDRSRVILQVAGVILGADYDNAYDFDSDFSGIDDVQNSDDVRDFLQSLVANSGIDPTQNETFIFATGDVDSEPDRERRLDIFALSPGLDGLNEDGELEEGGTIAPSIRAFLRNATAFRNEDGSGGIALGDSGLMIIGAPYGSVEGQSSDEQSGLLHADIGIDGEGATQRSTVSVTIGHVQYDADLDKTDDFPGEEVVLEGRTIGSTQDLGKGASTLAAGDIFNTAAGGGRRVDTDGDGVADSRVDGRATYFVIENFEPENGGRKGGKERPVGTSEGDIDFAFLRLGTGKSSTPTDELPSEGGTFSGFAAGMMEQETTGTSVQVTPTSLRADTFTMKLDPANNRMAVSNLQVGNQTLELGGVKGEETKGRSAYVDDNRFAARSDGEASDVAFVSGGVLQQAASTLPEGDAAREFLDVPEYKHLKWGFFFGDVDTGQDAGAREHIHLGSWIAGDVITDRSRLPTSGTATYSGHAFGNVVNDGALYAARGTFTNQWDFASRAGLAELGFDGANMRGITRLDNGTLKFSGALTGDSREAGIVGAFVRGDEAAGEPPAGQIGRFQVRGGSSYNAVGTFGAERE